MARAGSGLRPGRQWTVPATPGACDAARLPARLRPGDRARRSGGLAGEPAAVTRSGLPGAGGPEAEGNATARGYVSAFGAGWRLFAKRESVKAMPRVPGWIPVWPPDRHARARAAAWDSLRRAASTGAHDGRLRGSRGQALCVGPRRRRPAAGLAPKIDSASRPNLPRVKIDSPSGVQPAPRQAPSTTRVDLETGSAFSRRGHSSRPIYMPDL